MASRDQGTALSNHVQSQTVISMCHLAHTKRQSSWAVEHAQESVVTQRRPAVYILASERSGTLYVGVTGELSQRLEQHRTGEGSEFTNRYSVHRLVYAEFHDDMRTAIMREKQIKKWNRQWKMRLIEENNPRWRDLSEDLY